MDVVVNYDVLGLFMNNEDGSPLYFSMGPFGEERKLVKQLVEEGGGILFDKMQDLRFDDNCIKLVTKEVLTLKRDHDIFDYKYVEDCARSGRILPNLLDYRLNEQSQYAQYDPLQVLLGGSKWSTIPKTNEGEADNGDIPGRKVKTARKIPVASVGREVKTIQKLPVASVGKEVKPVRNRRFNYSKQDQLDIINFIIKKKAYRILKGNNFWKQMEESKVCGGSRTWQSMKEHFRKQVINKVRELGVTERRIRKMRACFNMDAWHSSDESSGEEEMAAEMHGKRLRPSSPLQLECNPSTNKDEIAVEMHMKRLRPRSPLQFNPSTKKDEMAAEMHMKRLRPSSPLQLECNPSTNKEEMAAEMHMKQIRPSSPLHLETNPSTNKEEMAPERHMKRLQLESRPTVNNRTYSPLPLVKQPTPDVSLKNKTYFLSDNAKQSPEQSNPHISLNSRTHSPLVHTKHLSKASISYASPKAPISDASPKVPISNASLKATIYDASLYNRPDSLNNKQELNSSTGSRPLFKRFGPNNLLKRPYPESPSAKSKNRLDKSFSFSKDKTVVDNSEKNNKKSLNGALVSSEKCSEPQTKLWLGKAKSGDTADSRKGTIKVVPLTVKERWIAKEKENDSPLDKGDKGVLEEKLVDESLVTPPQQSSLLTPPYRRKRRLSSPDKHDVSADRNVSSDDMFEDTPLRGRKNLRLDISMIGSSLEFGFGLKQAKEKSAETTFDVDGRVTSTQKYTQDYSEIIQDGQDFDTEL